MREIFCCKHVTLVLYYFCNKRETRNEVIRLKVLIKPDVLNTLQASLKKTDQEFADHIGVSRSSLWRAKLPVSDERFSLGQDVIAKVLNSFSDKSFEDLFFLDKVSHDCDKNEIPTEKEVVR
jgi:DNA-binding XRE family transcriptional regulator